MAKHNLLGKRGEERAAEYLIAKGYIIRDINWRSGKMELDLVAYHNQTLVIVEVKTRKNADFLHPADAVDMRKIKNIVRATDAYIRIFKIQYEVRFDIISLIGEDEENFEIEHIEDAFLSPLNY